MNFYRFFALILLFISGSLSAQSVKGVITDEQGAPLPYVSIYLKNTTTGTASNAEGRYELKLPSGKHDVVFQFIGYKTEVKSVELNNTTLSLDVQMAPQSAVLSEVVISADREDPAYAIIRKAIEKRPYYKDLIRSYECDVYVKGNQKVLDAPEKIMGVDVGDMEGMLDSSRQGIVYLSESVSKLYVDEGESKEVVTSSKVSGDDQGYSFNSARELEFSFYENTFELQRQMISPIANSALAYYKYRLEGVFQDEEGRLINQITVMPKRDSDPAFYGTIYIVDGLWNIHSLELGATAAATQVFFIDSLTFNQVYVPVEGPDKWALFSNTVTFKLGALGFKMMGTFTGVYSNYNLDPTFEKGFFDQYIHVVEPMSNERDSAYWEEIRPVPLTVEEVVDYDIKDSIKAVRTDPVYMDSVDRRGNRFELGDLLGGYNYTRRSKRLYYSIASPLNSLQFNTVQGYNANLNFEGRKYFDEKETRRVLFGVNANYGFSEKKARVSGYFTFRPSRLNYNQLTISGGSNIQQFNSQEPIGPFFNSFYTLFHRRNLAKYLDVKHLRLSYFAEPFNGTFVNSSIRWENRSPLINNSDQSYFFKDSRLFQPNEILDNIAAPEVFDEHQALLIDINATIGFKQKYWLYPDRKFGSGAKGPRLRLSYTGTFKALGGDVAYHKLAASLDDSWSVGVGGRFSWYVNGGFFFAKDNVQFKDFRHFMGSEVFLMKSADYRSTFLQLPYYQFSTDKQYFQAHVQHHFDGWILDKIPGFQKLGWSLVAGAKFLKAGDNPSYSELHVGFANMGYKILRLVRLDAVLSIHEGQTDWGLRMSLGLN